MVTNQLGKLRIDLVRSKCRALRLTFATAISEDTASNLGFTSKTSRFKSFYETYSRNEEQIVISLNVTKRIGEQETYAIRLSYQILGSDTMRFPSKRSKVSDVFTYLCDEKRELLFRCECLFSYKREVETSLFTLPIDLQDYKMFDQLRGMRLVKLENEKILWENSIDLPDMDTMTHRVKFAVDSTCNLELPNLLHKRAKEISRKTFD